MSSRLIKGSIIMVLIQAIGSLACFFASIYLVNKVGLKYFGEFSMVYAIFALTGSLAALGLPEYYQALIAKKATDREVLIVPTAGYLVIFIVQFTMVFFEESSTQIGGRDLTPLHHAFIYFALIGYIVTELACRVGFQAGHIIVPQMVLSLQAVVVWMCLVLDVYINGSANVLIPLIFTYSCFGLISLMYLLRKKHFDKIKFSLLPSRGLSEKAFLIRVAIQLFDAIPLTIANAAGHGYLAGIFAYIARLFGPIGMVSSSIIMQLQRTAFDSINHDRLSKKPFVINILVMILIGSLFAIVAALLAKKGYSDIVPRDDISMMLVIFLICLYRALFVSFQFSIQVYIRQIKTISVNKMILSALIVSLVTILFLENINVELILVMFLGMIGAAVSRVYRDIKMEMAL